MIVEESHEDGLKVHSFPEARGSGMKAFLNKVVDDFSSTVDHPSAQETVETIDANHTQTTNYDSGYNSGYRAILGVLKAVIQPLLKTREVVPVEVLLPSCMWIPTPQVKDFRAHRDCPQVVKGHSHAASCSIKKVHFMVPFRRNRDFIGREEYIQTLETKLCGSNKYCRVAQVGLGDIRKTPIALEYASLQEKSESLSVFWIHATAEERKEKAYQEIDREAKLVGTEDPEVDELQLGERWLEGEDSRVWVMIIANANDEKLFFGEDEDCASGPSRFADTLAHHFPRRLNGSVLLTICNKNFGVNFVAVGCVITIPKIVLSESKSLLMEKLEEDNYDDNALTEFVEALENLPLTLVQVAAFMRENSQSIAGYSRTYHGIDLSKIKLPSQALRTMKGILTARTLWLSLG